jgi:hypothetical protein
MKTHSNIKFQRIGVALMSMLLVLGCQNDDSDLQEAKYSTNPDVFIDTFSAGLNYAAFSGTDIFAFQVDSEVAYNKSSASMRFDVPNANDPAGAYAGGAFFTNTGRDLTSYNVLTFWAKSSVAATVGVIGYGIDLGENKYPASIENVRLSTVWKKYYIPIPDPSKLKTEKGMFYISAGPENNNGYSFWVDEVKFEKLGTIGQGQASILNGKNPIQNSYIGVSTTIEGLTCTFSLPNSVNQPVVLSPTYYNFVSSNNAVATVDTNGKVTAVGAGTAVITALFNGVKCAGSLTVNCSGAYIPAPVPTLPAANVISIFSNKYTNVPVNYYNGYWQPWQTTVSNDFTVNGDDVLNYTIFNFVGIEFSSPAVNATTMTNVHLDVFFPGPIAPNRELRVLIVDFGADGVYSGGDDTRHSTTFMAPTLVSQKWVSINIPFSSMPNLKSRAHLAQIILEGGDGSTLFVDNIYFNK